MAYEKTKYIGVRLDGFGKGTFEGSLDAPLHREEGGKMSTDLHDSQHLCRVEVRKHIKPGERWLVLQTVAMIEGEEPPPPPPPIKVTEYR